MSLSSWATPASISVGPVIVAVIVAVPVSVIVSLPMSRRHGGCAPVAPASVGVTSGNAQSSQARS